MAARPPRIPPASAAADYGAEDLSGYAAEELFPKLYDELHALARARRGGASLRPTELVHEAYLRLVHVPDRSFANRRHFIASAAVVMRHIVVDRIRARRAAKRGGGEVVLEPHLDALVPEVADEEHVLAVDAALDALSAMDARAAKVVTLRFFLGLTEPEVADALGVTDRTVRRDWVFARSWLARHLETSEAEAP